MREACSIGCPRFEGAELAADVAVFPGAQVSLCKDRNGQHGTRDRPKKGYHQYFSGAASRVCIGANNGLDPSRPGYCEKSGKE